MSCPEVDVRRRSISWRLGQRPRIIKDGILQAWASGNRKTGTEGNFLRRLKSVSRVTRNLENGEIVIWRPDGVASVARSQEGMAIIDGRIESVASVVRNQEGMVTIARRLEGVANISVRQEGVVSRGMLGESGAIRRPGHGETPTWRLTCMWWRCCQGQCSRRPK